MRAIPFTATALAALLAAAPPALADQIIQNLPAFQSLGDFTPFDISGARFNPALGTLTAVTGELTGTVTAGFFVSLPPFPTTRLSTTYFVFTPNSGSTGPNVFRGALADQTVTPVVQDDQAGAYNGAPTPVDLTFNFGDVSAFVGPPSPTALLVEFGFRASLPDRPGPNGGAADETTFSGGLRLTYTYTPTTAPVPEPGSLALLAAGLLGVGPVRRRRTGYPAGMRRTWPG